MTESIPIAAKPRKTLFQRLARWGLYLGYLIVVLWVSERLFWRFQAGVPLTAQADASHIWNFFYTELPRSGILEHAKRPPASNSFRVVLLGGSVLEQIASPFETALKQAVGERRTVEVYSLSSSARTSHDSLLKYQHLMDIGVECDLVIFYHGINDVRMNCCPEDQFRDDYSHCSFYKSFKRRLSAGKLNLASVVGDYVDNSIPLGEPDDEFRDYGNVIKTREPFRKNLLPIVKAARRHGHHAMVMTFAFDLPQNYTRERFDNGELGYAVGNYGMRAESWGHPDNVRRTIDAHNEVIREVAQAKGVVFVDQQRHLAGQRACFTDVCHLSDAGLEAMISHMIPPIVALLDIKQP
ncbi:MAG: SGNH/GDSL hydrolase family protein [Planctomycetota bacterium]|nr:SGNH/GDSL hydrolase family protein [Planctomycetota bacterium]